MFQPTDAYILVDATISGLKQNQSVNLAIHKCGDLSSSSYSCGDIFTNEFTNGNLGNIVADDEGRANLIVEKSGLKLHDLIGRSVVLHDTLTESRLASGVIARSAILSQNRKKVCACSGKTLWEERVDSPFA
ncbi:unnamed protein product [Echinostoma caproni]|uniref:Superoxide dismutase copper/zinc binding domain-containing protein n=1 Tax=Echinostoma caproni TaxID=27848 RepID=A0A3P8HUS6_9TREM|nr:unnamed protein product [Echinostoma caproni]